MKIISLNTWGCRVMDPLLNFFERYRDEVDIFCLQEVFNGQQSVLDKRLPGAGVRADGFTAIARVLTGFQGRFAQFSNDLNAKSVAMFIRNGVCDKVVWDDILIHKPVQALEPGTKELAARRILGAVVCTGKNMTLVTNYHGVWMSDGKMDTVERLEQSQRIRQYLDKFTVPTILCGDLNLNPDTESFKILADGRQDLISTYGITDTRTTLYSQYYTPGYSRYADYVLVSPHVKVREFRVLPDVVSDHAPLYADVTF